MTFCLPPEAHESLSLQKEILQFRRHLAIRRNMSHSVNASLFLTLNHFDKTQSLVVMTLTLHIPAAVAKSAVMTLTLRVPTVSITRDTCHFHWSCATVHGDSCAAVPMTHSPGVVTVIG